MTQLAVRSPSRQALTLLGAAAGILLAVSPTVHAAGGGPDAYGYTWTDDVSGCAIVNDVFLLPNTRDFWNGTQVTNTVGPLALGFSFPFYDQVVTQVWVGKNGLVHFQAPPAFPNDAYATNAAIPGAAGPAGFLAPYWDGLDPYFPSVYFEATPQYFKISYQATPLTSLVDLAYEVYLFPSGDIRVEYLQPSNAPRGATIGMENFTNDGGLQVCLDTSCSGGFTFASTTPQSLCFRRPAVLDCAPAAPLACGVTNGASPASVTANCDRYGCNSAATWPGKEKVYAFTLTELSDVAINLNPGGRNMGLFLLSQCHEFECISGGALSATANNLAPGTYYVVVDAARTLDEGAFQLTVNCTAISQPILCEESQGGDTTGQLSRLQTYPCLAGDFSGPESYYSLDFVPPGNINVTLATGTGQAAFILSEGGALSSANCLVGDYGGVSLFDPPPGRYLIVVDGPLGSAGPFTVSVACQPQIDCTPGAGTLLCNQKIISDTTGGPTFVNFYACTALQYAGPEHVYAIDNPQQQVMSFILDDVANPDLDIILMDSCNEGACVQVGDKQINKDLAPGRYYIVVDGLNGAAAPYSISAVCGKGISPDRISLTGAAGQCFDEHKTAWITPEITQADVLFTIDLTGSMGDERSQLQANMQDIIARLQTFIQDVAFGLVSYQDSSINGTTVPCSYFGGYGGAYPYQLHQPITTDSVAIQNQVNSLPPAGNGGDLPESYSRALWEAYNDPGIGWRPGSRRIVVDFGDEMPHDCNVLECLGEVSTSQRGKDPGRDDLPNTADDLAILEVMQGYADRQIVLLHLDSSGALSPPSPTEPAHTYAEIWDCWAQRTGGAAEALNSNGTVPAGIDLAELVGDLIAERGAYCSTLELVASLGYESWLVSSSPIYLGVQLPTVSEFDIRICVPPGTPAGPYDFEVQLLCAGGVVVSQQVHVDVVIDCAPSVVSLPADHVVCLGDSVTLDASGMSLVNCAGTVLYEWRDGASTLVGSTATVTLNPLVSDTYQVVVSCSTLPACQITAQSRVEVQVPPTFTTVRARDLFSCNLGLEVSWDAAIFHDPSASGVYNVYKSEVSCADALSRPPAVQGLSGLSWIDVGTRDGRSYHYAVEAEDARNGTACVPQGPHNGGAVTRVCSPMVLEVGDAAYPAVVGNILRVHHVGQQVTVDWSLARPLLAGEHFHLLKKRNTPDFAGWFQVNPEPGDLTRTLVETDSSARRQFFDLRVANACEEQSIDEFPQGYDDRDRDGVPEFWDNCPDLANPNQADSDGDGIGDLCD